MNIVFTHMEIDEGNPLLEHALYGNEVSGPFKVFYFRLDGRELAIRVYQDKQTSIWKILHLYHKEFAQRCPVCLKSHEHICSAPNEYQEKVFQALQKCKTFRLHSLFEL